MKIKHTVSTLTAALPALSITLAALFAATNITHAVTCAGLLALRRRK